MKSLTLLLLLILTLTPLAPTLTVAQEARTQETRTQEVTIPDGTSFTVLTVDELSSKTAAEGDPINMKVADDVVINGHVVIAKGTLVKGTITTVEQRGHMGKGGKLSLRVDSTTSVDGQKIKLRAAKGKGDTGTVGSTIALSVLISPLFLFRRGNHAVIKAGTKIQVYTDEEIKVKITAD